MHLSPEPLRRFSRFPGRTTAARTLALHILSRIPDGTPFVIEDITKEANQHGAVMSYSTASRVVLRLRDAGVVEVVPTPFTGELGRRPVTYRFKAAPKPAPFMSLEARLVSIEAKLDGLIEAMVATFGAKKEA